MWQNLDLGRYKVSIESDFFNIIIDKGVFWRTPCIIIYPVPVNQTLRTALENNWHEVSEEHNGSENSSELFCYSMKAICASALIVIVYRCIPRQN